MKTYLWGLDLGQGFEGAGGIAGLLAVTKHGQDGKENKRDNKEYALCWLPFYDGNGNVAGLVSVETGELAASYHYGPFGELLRSAGPAADGNPFRFSTKYCDWETGLCYFGYR